MHVWYSFYTCVIQRSITDPGQEAKTGRAFCRGALLTRLVHLARPHCLGVGQLGVNALINAITKHKEPGLKVSYFFL